MNRRQRNKALAKGSAIADCTGYMGDGPIVHIANSGSVYVHYHFGTLRVSNHHSSSDKCVRWNLDITKSKDSRRDYYGLDEIKKLIISIKRAYEYDR